MVVLENGVVVLKNFLRFLLGLLNLIVVILNVVVIFKDVLKDILKVYVVKIFYYSVGFIIVYFF